MGIKFLIKTNNNDENWIEPCSARSYWTCQRHRTQVS